MEQNNLFTRSAVNNIRPHAQDFMDKQFNKAREDLTNSDEFKGYLEEFLDNDYFNKLQKDKTTALETFKVAYTLHVERLIESRIKYSEYAKDETFKQTLISVLESDDNAYPVFNLTRFYNIFRDLGELEITNENWKDELIRLYEIQLDTGIEEDQRSYATEKMDFRYPNWWGFERELDALLSTLNRSSLEDVERAITNRFDFTSLVLNNNK